MLKTSLPWIRKCLSAVLALCALSASGLSWAVVGAIDNVPAATLLLPYFEDDLGNANGTQTTMKISNSSATAVLAHVVMWTDLGIPTLEFNLYLVGYDTVVLDLRLLFQGIVPQTASAGQDPTDKISPKGSHSQDINFASCNGKLPPAGLPPTTLGVVPLNTPWEPTTLAAIRAAHTGQASTLWSGQCGAVVYGDNVARGYITVDTVNNCTTRYPSDAGYFGAWWHRRCDQPKRALWQLYHPEPQHEYGGQRKLGAYRGKRDGSADHYLGKADLLFALRQQYGD